MRPRARRVSAMKGFRVRLDRLMARLQPANIASARVAQKIGMSFKRKATGAEGVAIHIYYLDRLGWERRVLRVGG
jgi:RimJ/RimL family protein N-acetyltransferase